MASILVPTNDVFASRENDKVWKKLKEEIKDKVN